MRDREVDVIQSGGAAGEDLTHIVDDNFGHISSVGPASRRRDSVQRPAPDCRATLQTRPDTAHGGSMASNSSPPVVVGVDGSPSSLGALDYAAQWAVRRQTSLRMVNVLARPYHAFPYGGFLILKPDEQLRAAADARLRELADKVRSERPDLTGVQAVTAIGHSAAVLIEQSRQAAVTVVGCRGVGGFEQLMLGSTSAHLAAHGHGAIVIIRPPVAVAPDPVQRAPHRTLGPILACCDGSPASVAALRFAAGEAALRDVPLTVAHVYERDEPAAKQLLIEAVAPWADDYPGKPIELRPIYSQHQPQYALLEASRHAALTVIGARGHSGLTSLLLGSVSRYLIHQAYGPVAVVHPAEQGKEGK